MIIPEHLLVKDVVNVVKTYDQQSAGDRKWYFYGDPSSKKSNQIGYKVFFYGVALLDTGELVYFRWRNEEGYPIYQGMPLLGRGIYHHCEKINE